MITAQLSSVNRLSSLAVTMTSRTRWSAALLFPLVVGPVWCLAWHGSGGRLGTLTGLILLGSLVVSAITDFNRQRIYNWVTYPAFLWVVAINVFVSIKMYSGESLFPAFAATDFVGPPWLGGIGLAECLAGAGVCFLITLFGYDLSGGGAGDVKIAAVIGAVLGLHHGLFAVAYSYVVAAIAIIVWSTWKHGPLVLLKAAARTIGRVLGPLWPFASTSDDHALLLTPVPLGPYFAIGTLFVALELVPS